MMLAVTAAVALVLGFIVGMATLKRSTHWCPACGSVLRCVDCAGRPTAQEMRARLRVRRAA